MPATSPAVYFPPTAATSRNRTDLALNDCVKYCRIALVRFQPPSCTSLTCGFAEIAGRVMEETTCEAASRLLHRNARTFWGLDQFRMGVLLERMKLPSGINLSYLSADEVHFKTFWTGGEKGPFAKRWAPQFVTNLVCYHGGKVLGNAAW